MGAQFQDIVLFSPTFRLNVHVFSLFISIFLPPMDLEMS